MALTDQERTYWRQQADAGVKPAQIAAAIKAQRAGGSGSAPSSETPKQEQPPRPAPAQDSAPEPVADPMTGLDVSDVGAARSALAAPGRFAHAAAKLGEGLSLDPFDNGGQNVQGLITGQAAPGSARRQFLRGVSNATTFGLAEKAGNAADPKFAASRPADEKAAPGYEGAGEVAGMFLPNAPGKAVEGIGKAFLGGAPERVGARILSNVASGEAGGAAKGKTAAKMLAKAGPEGQKALDVIEETGLTGTLATKAAAKPAKALKEVQAVLDHNEATTLGPVYKAIDAAGTGPDTTTIGSKLIDHANQLRAAGEPEVAARIDRYVKFLDQNYKPDQVLSGSMIRKLKGTIGESAFEHVQDAATPLGEKVKREIYGIYSKAIEDAATKTPGVDLQALRTGNERASQLLGVAANLSERATKAAAGRTGLATAIGTGAFHAGMATELGHALISGNASKAAAILASEGGLQLVKRIPQMIRHIDLAASKVEKARRASAIVNEAISRIGRGGARSASIMTGRAINAPDEQETDE